MGRSLGVPVTRTAVERKNGSTFGCTCELDSCWDGESCSLKCACDLDYPQPTTIYTSLVLVAQLIVLLPSMVAAPGSPLAAGGFD